MTTYDLYLESGPKRRKTMVHVLDLLGCVAVGPTTDEALAATPDAIRAYRRFLFRNGEAVDAGEPIELRIAEHVTEGGWLGNGSPYLAFGPDFRPVADEEIETYVARLGWLCDELASWTTVQTDVRLDATPGTGGRTARQILLHVLGAQGAYLAPALGSAPGFGRISGAAERGEIPLAEALRRAAALGGERIRATTPEERSRVRELPAGPRTLRKAIRRMLEHDWEHLAELSRRPGGPTL
jgi:predicted RNase H-like HicB family nuclease